jgi:ribosomal protein S18 acetylase RimI-like enzyme
MRPAEVERALVKTEMMYDWHLRVDPTVSREAVHLMNSVPGQDWFDKYPEHWYLSRLAVDPAFQRRGIGGMLLDWGLRIAKEENVPVGLTSSPQGVALYRRKGFRDIGWLALTDGIEGPALIWEADPKKIEEAIEADGAVVVSNVVPL